MEVKQVSFHNNEPFNDVMKHKQNIEGYPRHTGGKVPLPVKLLIYFTLGSAFLSFLFSIIRFFVFEL